MHNRTGPARDVVRDRRVRDGLVLVPLVLAIVAFALYPQAALDDAERVGASARWRRCCRPGGAPRRRAEVRAVIVLRAGPRARRSTGRRSSPRRRADRRARASCCCSGSPRARVRAHARRAGADAARARASPPGCAIWQWDENASIIEGALAMDDLTLALTLLFCAAGIGHGAAVVAQRAPPREAGEGEYYALLLTSILGMVVLVAARELRRAVHRLRAALDPALRAVRDRTCGASTRSSRA